MSHVERGGHCTLCDGSHFGSYSCPFQCDRCRVHVELCEQADCPRNARWEREKANVWPQPAKPTAESILLELLAVEDLLVRVDNSIRQSPTKMVDLALLTEYINRKAAAWAAAREWKLKGGEIDGLQQFECR